MQPRVHRLSAFGDGPKANTYILELGLSTMNIRRDMALTEDVRVRQYDPFIIPWHTHKVMPISFISSVLAVRFVRMKKS